jgi:hypothetical protein
MSVVVAAWTNDVSLISCKVRCCKGSLLTISCLYPHQTLSPKLIVHGHYDHLWSMISLLWSNRVQQLWVSRGVSTCVWLLGGVFRKLDADTAQLCFKQRFRRQRPPGSSLVEGTPPSRSWEQYSDESFSKAFRLLVGGWPTPLKNMKVNWDHYSQYMENHHF